MTITASALIARALRLIRATASGETPTSAEQADCLTALNAMVDSWMLDRLTIPVVTRTTEVLVASTQDYTIGSGATIDVERPSVIQDAGLIPAGLTSEIPLGIFSDDEWAKIRIKSQTATFPQGVYYNHGFSSSGYGTVSVWPIPTTAPTLVLYTPDAVLTTFAAVGTSYVVPPGYERALCYNLAMEIADEFGKQVPAAVALIAVDAKAAMQRANIRPLKLGCDAGVLRRGGSGAGTYNWRSDAGA